MSLTCVIVVQRDVPGMTRGILPVITELWWGPIVRAISVGVNSASPAPAVPLNEPFLWRDDASGAEVIAFWHAGGYGGETEYKGHTLALTPAPDCVRAPAGESGERAILCFSWRGDNKGPFDDPKEVLATDDTCHCNCSYRRLCACSPTRLLSGCVPLATAFRDVDFSRPSARSYLRLCCVVNTPGTCRQCVKFSRRAS